MPIRKENPFLHMRESALRGNPTRSVRWYQDQIRKLGYGLGKATPQRVMNSRIGANDDDAAIGRMSLFLYDPKHKATLPHYDRFPLVIPFRGHVDGFTGVNMHYLRPHERMAFLQTIMAIQSGEGLTWNALVAHASLFAKHCVKRYLYTHVKSKYFLKINEEDWKTAIMLPCEDFKKQSKYTAYKIKDESDG